VGEAAEGRGHRRLELKAHHEKQHVGTRAQGREEEARAHSHPVVAVEGGRGEAVAVARVAAEDATLQHIFCQAQAAVPRSGDEVHEHCLHRSQREEFAQLHGKDTQEQKTYHRFQKIMNTTKKLEDAYLRWDRGVLENSEGKSAAKAKRQRQKHHREHESPHGLPVDFHSEFTGAVAAKPGKILRKRASRKGLKE
jgi:hypothetical protein